MYLEIINVHAREILDSRGTPTVEAEITVRRRPDCSGAGNDAELSAVRSPILPDTASCHITARASVPSGASTGQFEATELRDGEPRYFGLGVQRAVKNVNTKLKDALLGKNALRQTEIDRILIETDGTDSKSNLGANAALSVSLAVARAAAKALQLPLWQYLGGIRAGRMPIPMMNILNGGKHANNTVDFQEFMIMPVSGENFADTLRMGAEVYHNLKKLCRERGLTTAVGDEGGFAPDLPDAFAVLDLIIEAIRAAGYAPGTDIKIALDAAASELYRPEDERYYFPGESRKCDVQIVRTTEEMIAYYENLISRYPICSIEDGLAEEDWDGWQEMTARLGGKVQLVGDDLFVTNPKRLEAGIKLGAANAILVKVNQIGTLSEAMEAIEMAHRSGYRTVISHRSGETEDTTIADLAVAVNAGQIKTGAPCRAERTAKYNQLLRIEEQLGNARII